MVNDSADATVAPHAQSADEAEGRLHLAGHSVAKARNVALDLAWDHHLDTARRMISRHAVSINARRRHERVEVLGQALLLHNRLALRQCGVRKEGCALKCGDVLRLGRALNSEVGFELGLADDTNVYECGHGFAHEAFYGLAGHERQSVGIFNHEGVGLGPGPESTAAKCQ